MELIGNLSKHDWFFSAKTIDSLTKGAENSSRMYRGKVRDFSASQLVKAVKGYELFRTELDSVSLFDDLAFSANMTLPETQSLFDKVNKTGARLCKMLAFFELKKIA